MRIAIFAGESSGDLLGAGLIRAIAARHPQARFEGIAGPRMMAAGCESLYPIERLSVLGLFETFSRYPELIPVRRRLAKQFVADPPDVLVGVDAPDFNLSLELMVRQEGGIPTVHYASPSVWAWRRYRLRKIRRAVDLMLTLFPFEAEFFHQYGVSARFVGHPLADMVPDTPDQAAARRELGLPTRGEVVALLPGSRIMELERLAEPMVRTARWLAHRRPELRFVAPLVNADVRRRFEKALAACSDCPRIQLLSGQSMVAITAADAVLLASGTATLEALLLKRPMVITYRINRLTWLIGKLVVNTSYVGLPNLLAGKGLVPELLQNDAVPDKLGTALLRFLDDPELTRSLKQEFQRIHGVLKNDAAERAADAVLELIGRPVKGA